MQINNRRVAEKLFVSYSAISMIRRGLRFPSLATMEAIEKEFGWSVGDQMTARHDYPAAFDAVVSNWYRENGLHS